MCVAACGEGVGGQRLPCRVVVGSLGEEIGRLVLATGSGGRAPNESFCCRPPDLDS